MLLLGVTSGGRCCLGVGAVSSSRLGIGSIILLTIALLKEENKTCVRLLRTNIK